jgi:hypothetical protein
MGMTEPVHRDQAAVLNYCDGLLRKRVQGRQRELVVTVVGE